MTAKDYKTLENIGLSQNEIKVYFGLIELGETTTTPLVKYVKIPISKIYPTLDKLLQKGLVSYILKNNVKHFKATDPKRIIHLLEEKEKQIQSQKTEINYIIPKLILRRKLADKKQEATIYEGFRGIQAVYDNMLASMKKGDEYYVFNLGEKDNYVKYKLFYRNYHLKRDKKGVFVKIITENKFKSIVEYVFKNLKKCETRFSKEPLPSSTLIHNDTVVTLLMGDNPTAIVVESKQNAEQYKRFFHNIWKKAEK
ncbi:MAG: helix-turn-helix domain-containing protein [Candidatus Woesearchaeota archaeon]